MNLTFTLNGRTVDLEDIPGEASLLEVIRDHLGMIGTKEGCGVGGLLKHLRHSLLA